LPRKPSSSLPFKPEEVFGDNWPIRRRWMLRILCWAIANSQLIILSAIFWNTENPLLLNALIAFLALIGSIVATYVFGANWDDKDKRRHFVDMGYMPPGCSSSPEPEPIEADPNVAG
jgi:hypothetical protein